MSLDFFFYNDAPDVDALWDLMLNAGSHEDSPPEVFAGLLQAWWTLAEADEETVESLTYEEAHNLYRQVFVKSYNSEKTLRNYDESDGVWWPESLPTKGWFPKRVVIRIAQICASKEVSELKAMHAYLRREHPEEFPAEKFVVQEGS
jgi:hypothetical protein